MELLTNSLGHLHAAVALEWLVVAMGAFVGLDLSQRVVAGRVYDSLRWLVCAALGLGTALWAAMAIHVAAVSLPFPIGYHPADIAGVWALTLALAGAALLVAVGRPATPARVLSAALLLALAALLTQLGMLLSLGLKPGITWNTIGLGLSALAAVSGQCSRSLWPACSRRAAAAARCTGNWRRQRCSGSRWWPASTW
jgi:NO-binding membrane sensor protein with MHYT domain